MTDKIKESILDYVHKSKISEKDIIVGDAITAKELANHKYAVLQSDEIALVLINKPGKLLKTGMVITNKRIYYSTLKRSFWTSMLQAILKPITGSVEFNQMEHFQIGEHDSCLGSDYVGHDLEINQHTIGLLRMGKGITLNEKMIEFINGLSEHLVKTGILSVMPKKYSWQ